MWIKYIVLFLWIPVRCSGNHFINQVVHETQVSLLAIRTDHCPQSWLQKLLMTPPVPVMLQSFGTNYLTQPFSDQLHVICLSSSDTSSKDQLVTLFQNIRKERSIFLVDGNYADSERRLRSLLKLCYKWRVLNVVVVLLTQGEEGSFYYRYRPYPRFMLEQRPKDKGPFFVHFKQFLNMHKQPLTILPDQKHPRTIIYEDMRTGSNVLAGSVGRFVHTLAWKLNASLEYPQELRPGPSLHPTEMIALAESLQIDIPAGMVFLEQPRQLAHMSYPFELSHICLMIPVTQPIPIKDIYPTLFSVQHILIALSIVYGFGWVLSLQKQLSGYPTRVVDYLIDDAALRGLLGQSFRQRMQSQTLSTSWTYLLLGFLGLNLNSIHEAALGTLLTHPPKYFQPRTFEDVHELQIPIVLDLADFNSMDEQPIPLLASLLTPVNVSELNRLRDKLNQSNAYFASRLKWSLLSAQQKYFPQEVFLYSMDACLSALSLMGFQLPANSWFEEPLSRLILDVRANGLFQHWVEMHFYDMVAAGLISFSDTIERQLPRVGGSLRLEDLQWIGFAYASLLSVAATVLVLEVTLDKARRWYSYTGV